MLWGEINRFIQTSSHPGNRKRQGILDSDKGGPLVLTHHTLKKLIQQGGEDGTYEECPISYVIGMVAGPGREAAMQGHHANPMGVEDANDLLPRTLFICDEASSVPDIYWNMASPWMARALVIGNTWPCDNFFYRAVKGHPDPKVPDRGGDLLRDPDKPHLGHLRRVIHITAEDSPNVRLGLAQEKAGIEPTNEVLVPGVKPFAEYKDDLRTWDEVQICVSHKAQFYEGAENLLYPPHWLNHAEELYERIRGTLRRTKSIGIDPGWASFRKSTVLYAVDEFGVVERLAQSTPNTALIPRLVVDFARRHGLQDNPRSWCMDMGGGGKQIADAIELLENGRYKNLGGVRLIGFGESLVQDPKRGLTRIEEKVDQREDRYVYVNRRAQMYGDLSILLDPDCVTLAAARRGWAYGLGGFAIPRECSELRRQLAKIPKWYDEEGRLYLPPKMRKPTDKGTQDKITINSLIGCSPDEADALVLAVHGLLHKRKQAIAGGF